MWIRTRRYVRLRPGRDLLLLFAFTVLLPGLVLTVVGIRSLLREQTLAEQQVLARLEGMAARAADRLDRELGTWRALLERAGQAGSLDAGTLPPWMQQAASDAAVAVVINGSSDHHVWPDRGLPYWPWPDTTPGREPSARLADAESLELRERDYAGALRRYKALASTVAADDRPELLLRIAMTQRKDAQWADSLKTLQELTSLPPGPIGSVPSDLAARAEICAHYAAKGPASALAAAALELERDLIAGRWMLDQPRYLDYVNRAREWSSVDSGSATARERAKLQVLDERKRALADAVTGDGSTTHLIMRVTAKSDREARTASLAVSTQWLNSHFWPDVLTPLVEAGFYLSIVDTGGTTIFESARSGEAPEPTAPPVGVRPLREAVLPWHVEARPQNTTALYADLARGRSLSVAMLGVTLVLLGFGTYLTARVVRRELEIARMKSDFVSAVSHEFRSPLTGIRQLAEMLMRGRVPSEERRQEYYERITHEADRLTRVVENVLDFARTEDGRRTYAFESIDTGAWLTGVVEEFRPLASSSGHAIEATIPDTLPRVVADREALASVVHNLLDNAVRYSPHADTVWLTATAMNGHVTIEVRDRGIGIADVDRSHLFDRFYRGSTDAARQTKGTGLGLSLARHIVDAHGGRIDFTSTPGDGSTFAIHMRADTGVGAELPVRT